MSEKLLRNAEQAAQIFLRPKDVKYDSPEEREHYLTVWYHPKSKSLEGWRVWYSYRGEIGGIERYNWNPLESTYVALELALQLGITITPRGKGNRERHKNFRLDVVKAAAEMAK